MAQYQADITFEGKKEKKVFKQSDKFEMTVERANEIQKNIKDEYGIDKVMTRLDEPKTDDNPDDKEKADDKEKETEKKNAKK